MEQRDAPTQQNWVYIGAYLIDQVSLKQGPREFAAAHHADAAAWLVLQPTDKARGIFANQPYSGLRALAERSCEDVIVDTCVGTSANGAGHIISLAPHKNGIDPFPVGRSQPLNVFGPVQPVDGAISASYETVEAACGAIRYYAHLEVRRRKRDVWCSPTPPVQLQAHYHHWQRSRTPTVLVSCNVRWAACASRYAICHARMPTMARDGREQPRQPFAWPARCRVL